MSNVISFFKARAQRDGTDEKPKKQLKEFGDQLSLQFSDLKIVIFVQISDFGPTEDFLHFCDSSNPGALLDMRIVPRLDFVSSSRSQAFKLFDAIGVQYQDAFGSLNLTSYDLDDHNLERLATSAQSLVNETSDQPILALFDDIRFSMKCLPKFANYFDVVYMDSTQVGRLILDGTRVQM